MPWTQTTPAAASLNHSQPNGSRLNTAALVITGLAFVGVTAFMAVQLCHRLIEAVGLDAARKTALPVMTVGALGALGVGAAGAILLIMAGRPRWAIPYACWFAAGTAATVAAVLGELDAGLQSALSQGAMISVLPIPLMLVLYLLTLLVRNALVCPMVDTFSFLGEVLETIATKTPWGPRWGKLLAVLAAVWIVLCGFYVFRAAL